MLFSEEEILKIIHLKEIARIFNNLEDSFFISNIKNIELSELDESKKKDLDSTTKVNINYVFSVIKDLINRLDKELNNKEYIESLNFVLFRVITRFKVDLLDFEASFNAKAFGDNDAFNRLMDIILEFLKRIFPSLLFIYLGENDFRYFIQLFGRFLRNDEGLLNNNYNKDSLHERLVVVEAKINHLSESSAINKEKFQEVLNELLSKNRLAFDKSIAENINIFREELNKIQSHYSEELSLKVANLKNSVDHSHEEVLNLDQAIESFKSTVSTKIQNEISKHYQKKAKMEMLTYWGATGFSILLILSSLGLLAWGLVDYYHDYISTNVCLKDEAFNACVTRLEKVRDITKNIGITFFIMRFSFSLLLFLTVIYTSRIAIRAYSHWRHSENMHLKLSSLDPFITELPKDVRHEIHRELIPDYFGKDAGLVDTANEKFKDLPANVSAVAIKAIEQISGSGSNSSTEKNGKKSEGGTE